ncbi:MAG: helicase-exonuclease AddAB subunit AddB [Tyzzerella sp.]|nr:helicase-exonuclease AddAB subunit AddB [Tyzzerella sp.]
MSLQFVMGPSGSGKSHYLYQKVTEESLQNPDKNYIVLVPEQFTMQTQKDLVMASPRKGIMNVDVLSFNRLAYRIFEETGENQRVILDDVGKNFVIRKIAGDYESELKILGSNLKKVGYISEIKSIISEFAQYDIQAKELEQMLENAGANSNLYYKLNDIRMVYQGFQEYLQDKYITGEEMLEILCTVASKSKLLAGSTLVLDGFTGFTPVQNKLLRELLKICEKVVVTVNMDERENPFVYKHPYQLFALSKQMVTSLLAIAREVKAEIEEAVYLYQKPVYRFKENEALGFLESHLFRYSKERYEKEQDSVQIWCAKNPQEEIDFVAQKIRQFVRTKGYRYRDVAVIASDMNAYANHIEKIFERYDIPVFMDHKRSILLNSFVEYLRSLLAMVEQNFTYESVFRYLRTGLTGLSMDEVDTLENYVIALGIRGYKKWQEKWIRRTNGMEETELAEINRIREVFISKIEAVTEVLKRRHKTVLEVTQALHDFFLQEKLQKRVKEIEISFAEQGELALEKEYAQVYRIVIELFEKFVELLGEERISLKEYCELLDAGLEQAKVGIIPPSIDQVVVGDVERTRLKDVKVILFVGVNDVYIPGKAKKGGILSEHDRERFAKDGVSLAPSAKEKTFIQKFYLYLMLTKPTDYVFLTFSKAASDGNSLRPAYLIPDVLKMYPELKVQMVVQELSEKELTMESGVTYLVEGLQQKHKGLGPEWQELYSWYKAHPEWSKKIKQIVEAAFYRKPEGSLTRETAKKLYGEILENSVTRLEKFSACAYAHFLTYGLRLKEREEYQFQAVDMGNLFHGALERFSKKLEREGCSWTNISEEQKEAFIDASVEECIVDYGNTILYSTARNEYIITRLKRMMHRTVWALAKQLEKGDFIPKGYEITFGGLSGISTSNMELQDLGRMRLLGKIDRVDICEDDEHVYVKIIDYKTGAKAFDLGELCYGLQMQLVIYMNAATEMEQRKHPDKKVIPTGLFYYQMKDPIVEKTADEEMLEHLILKELRPDGVVQSTEEVLEHLEHSLTGTSQVIPVARNKDGSLSKKSKVLSEEEFWVISEFANKKAQKLGTKILEGDIEIAPYEMGDRRGCDFCPYHAICGFEEKIPGYHYRKMDKLDSEEAIREMRKEVVTWE